ncbi:hypothetical protein [Halioxenophilus aromaticivorans]|uniref:Uncharacterized protein n=1 Tax=Halioxenophilus aromaticivorans TaxID=1306992 RepID=A0AAV3U0C6_9ALTE
MLNLVAKYSRGLVVTAVLWPWSVFAQSFSLADGAVPLQQRIDNAEVVAAITVETAMEQINLALSKNGRFVSEGVRYGAVVDEVWKGRLTVGEDLIKFNVSLNNCYKTLALAEEYLVLARLNNSGELAIDSCDDFVLRSTAPRKFASVSP